MARSRQSLVTDLLEIASKLPWKISVGIAVISLLALHLVAAAVAPPPVVTNPADFAGVVIHQGIHVGAFLFQFIIPPAFLIGAVVSFSNGRSRFACSPRLAPVALPRWHHSPGSNLRAL